MKVILATALALAVLVQGSHSQSNNDGEDVCKLPPEKGRCRARKPKFFFNQDTNRCEMFFYSGCDGNENRFSSLLECHKKCSHLVQKSNEALNKALAPHVKNSFCVQPPIETQRRCRAAFPRYTFNAETGRCEQYLYGGCGGTKNLFTSTQECVSACVVVNSNAGAAVRLRGSFRGRAMIPEESQKKDITAITFPGYPMKNEEDVCKLPPIEPGLIACLAFSEKWTYNAEKGECEKYTYGGCRGTENLFDSKEECQARCGNSILGQRTIDNEAEFARPDLCMQPPLQEPEPGKVGISCLAYMPKFTFDAKMGKCIPYIYGGCRGTENLFDTKNECLKTCDPARLPKPKTLDVCSQPIMVGPCKGAEPSYGFNLATRRCELFLYGGCKGNENRFSSVEDCVNTCGGLEPVEDPMCSLVTCNRHEARFYRAKGCTPITKAGECCPSSWDCSRWDERLLRPDECFVANEDIPEGKFYSNGEKIPELSKGCNVACRCVSRPGSSFATPTCAIVDCPFGQAFPDGKEDCRKIYSDKTSCCNAELRCDEELESMPKCTFENQTYVARQQMYSEEDPCRICICKEGWKGEATDEFCYTSDPYSRHPEKLIQNCQPVFSEKRCGPVDWICPDDEPVVGLSAPVAKIAVVCPEGSEVIESVADESVKPLIEPLETSEGTVGPSAKAKPSDVCLLPKAQGPCTGFRQAWYFDVLDRECKPFMYGDYEFAGKNVFYTEQNCKQVCEKYLLEESKRDPARCEAGSEEGRPDMDPSNKFDRCLPKRKFRFNKSTQKCENFVQLGCQGNEDSFETIDECEAVCGLSNRQDESLRNNDGEAKIPGKSEVCSLPVRAGNCRSRVLRFYYDEKSGICRQFWFSGCQGNENNFEDLRSCLDKCVPDESLGRALQGQSLEIKNPCEQEKKVGPCRGAKPMWYFDKNTFTCKLFQYGGCRGNDNRFETFHDCVQTCPVDHTKQKKIRESCLEPADSGPCEAAKPRYYYNKDTNKCEFFIYGGCQGNQNNFETKSDCMLTCQFSWKEGGIIVAGDAVTLPAVAPPRPGLALAPSRPWLDRENNQLLREPRVIKVGLAATLPMDLNSNGAEKATTLPAVLDPCLLDKEVGICRAAFRRFYFDKEQKKCKQFFYGGCKGNANNFGSKTECMLTCSKHMEESKTALASARSAEKLESAVPRNPECALPMDTGPCRAMRPKWFYNSTSNRCEQFFWGGCRGNLNRFESKQDCHSQCGNPSRVPRAPFERRRSPVKLPPVPPKCESKGKTFNLGDAIRFNTDRCLTCSCNSPPNLTCVRKTCEPEPPMEDDEKARCKYTYDDDGCCVIGIACVSANPPYFDPAEV